MRFRGYLPLWMAVVLAGMVVLVLAIWTWQSMSSETSDGRQTIVLWGGDQQGDDFTSLINQFESLPENCDPQTGKPKYKVILGSATSPNMTGDAQRLMCAIAGQVPPEVLLFDRFAIGEWAGRGALENLSPYIDAQRPDDPHRINVDEYCKWPIEESEYSAGIQAGVQGDQGDDAGHAAPAGHACWRAAMEAASAGDGRWVAAHLPPAGARRDGRKSPRRASRRG